MTDQELHPWRSKGLLGQGTHGVINLFQNDTDESYIAVKYSKYFLRDLKPKYVEYWNQEVEIMKKMTHENVVQHRQVPDVIKNKLAKISDMPPIGMEYCNGGDLRKVLIENPNGLQEEQIKDVLHQIAKGIKFLHENRILHRDIKPENVALNKSSNGSKITYKLIDFGLGKDFKHTASLATSGVGTLCYMAPEIFGQQVYTWTADYWSFGVMANEVVTGHRPWFHKDSPFLWLKELSRKSPIHIGAYYDDKKQVVFVESLDAAQVSDGLKANLETFFRCVFQLDPEQRRTVPENLREPNIKNPLDWLLSFLIK